MPNKFFRVISEKFILITLFYFAVITFLACVDGIFPPTKVYGAELNSQVVCEDLIEEINTLRANVGEEPLIVDNELVSVASIRAEEAAEEFSHTRPNGSRGVELIKGNVWKGENLSYVADAFNEAEAVTAMFRELKDSPVHRENMELPEFQKIGVAAYQNNGRMTVAYMFSS